MQRKNDKKKGERPPYDCILMFRILVLQELYQLSDDEMEFQIYDRSSFQQFVGIRDGDSIPDAKTIGVFKDKLADQNVHKSLFDTFQAQLEASGYHARSVQIIDATIHEVRRPSQRTRTLMKRHLQKHNGIQTLLLRKKEARPSLATKIM